jgi:hypothetical protein
MKKIGTTSAGTVIVEMTAAQFKSLFEISETSTAQPAVDSMSVAERVAFVRERIAKLSPKKKNGVVHSIAAMFQFTGGISEPCIDEIIGHLQGEKFFAIDEAGRVIYKKG